MKLDWIRRSAMLVIATGVMTLSGSTFADEGDANPGLYDGHPIIDATAATWEQVEQLQSWGIVPLECHVHIGTGRYVAPPEALPLMDKAGIAYDVIVEDVQPLLDAERDRLQGGVAQGNWFADYKDYDAILAYMDSLIALEPGIMTKFDIGLTIEGRMIQGYRISGPGTDKPAVMFNGTQHAREWVSPMVNVYIADQLVRNYSTDPNVQELVDDVEFFIVPVFNIDGYLHSWGPDRFWRKNRRNNGGGDFGVDLNRNWSVDWNGGQSNSNDPGSDVYVGTAPFSEPETQALSAFITANPQIVAHIDFHSYQQVVLRTWGYTNTLPPDITLINDLGSQMSDAIFDVHGSNYPHGGGGDLLYLASGIFPDWAYGERGILSWTIELRPSSPAGGGFELPPAQILPTGEENFEAALVLATWAQASPALNFSFPDGRPDTITPNTTTTLTLGLEAQFGAVIIGGSETLYTRIGNSGPFTTSTLTPVGSDLYEAVLPAVPCGETLEYYFEATTDNAESFTSPDDAPASVYSANSLDVDVIAAFDFEVDPNWLVSGNVTDGQWDLGVPVGGGDRSDPVTDSDGSGACYLTDNVDGNSDVDGGVTILTTGTFDLTGGADIAWDYWLNDETNPMSPEDYFIVEIATDLNGTNWQQIANYTAAGSWRSDAYTVSEADATNTVRVRFSVADEGTGNVIEAGVDAFTISNSGCDEVITCDADVVGNDKEVNIQDLLALLAAWGSADPTFDIAPEGGDGAVDIQDLLVMLSSWGPCP